jgi:Ca2+-binding RTX toxin-like protein
VGGSGHNTLIGGAGPSILIGGGGRDVLTAKAGAAILIAGTTDFDANAAALRALLTEWSRTDETYAQKVAHLSGGATGGKNGSYVLDDTTVHHVGGPSQLKGGMGRDWFFARLTGRRHDTLQHVKPGEMVTNI